MAIRSTLTMANAANIAVRNAACINGDNLNCRFTEEDRNENM